MCCATACMSWAWGLVRWSQRRSLPHTYTCSSGSLPCICMHAATRQRVYYHHANRSDYKIVTRTSTRSYHKDLINSQFCLVPTGTGSGRRAVVAAIMGCVPLTVTDGVLQPFEPEMHWEQHAVDVREKDIPLLHKVRPWKAAETSCLSAKK